MLRSYGAFLFLRLIIPPPGGGGVNKDCFPTGAFLFLRLIIPGLTARDNLAPFELE